MNDKAIKLIKGLLLSATVALAGRVNAADKNAVTSPDLDLGPTDRATEVDQEPQKIMRNVCRIQRNGEYKLIAGHRSHRSHSSHRSSSSGHYSHSSSSYHSHSSSSSYGSSNTSSSTTTYTTTPKTYQLGDRSLSKGDSGLDVSELVNKLEGFAYLKKEGLTKKDQYYVYDTAVEKAVKHFQKDYGGQVDGCISVSQIKGLQAWNINNTTIELGFRPLSELMHGYDVDVLIKCLTKAGYSPDPKKLIKSGNHYVFVEDVTTAIKMFQAYNSMEPTGKLDTSTLTQLKKFEK
jgi:hypothetical protein